jgi:Protein of unknown function (DUF2442)
MEIPVVVAVNVVGPAVLRVHFANGQVRDFDCTPYLGRGVFVRLKDPVLFAQAHVAHGTVCWPGSLDIAPETVFLRSVLVEARTPVRSTP